MKGRAPPTQPRGLTAVEGTTGTKDWYPLTDTDSRLTPGDGQRGTSRGGWGPGGGSEKVAEAG